MIQEVLKALLEVLHRRENLLLFGDTLRFFLSLDAVLTLLFWGQTVGGVHVLKASLLWGEVFEIRISAGRYATCRGF